MMTGTQSQIEWAELIKPRVTAEFDRVAGAFQTVASTQKGQARLDTLALIAVLEEKRSEVLAHDHAGYFISTWRELKDQVRLMIAQDPRFLIIQASRQERC